MEHVLPFGDKLIAIDRSNSLLVFDVSTTELEGSFQFGSSIANSDDHEAKATFTCCTMMHPATYINKVLLGSREGTLRLFNVRRLSVVHTFTSLKFDCSISCIEQAPALDLVAVGSARGCIALLNLREGTLTGLVKAFFHQVQDLSSCSLCS